MIIKIGEVEWHDLKRRMTWPNNGECPHKRLQYIDHGELVKCLDCDKQVTAVWALQMYFSQHERQKELLAVQQDNLRKDLEKTVVHRAALIVQDAWRRLKFVPTCPHCRKPIMPPDGFGKSATRSKEGSLPLVMRPNLSLMDGTE
jgi:hypothetical protein